MAVVRSGAKATAASRTFDGRCVKTIVRRSPIRAAMRTAAWNEKACRIPIAEKRTASVSVEASYFRVKR